MPITTGSRLGPYDVLAPLGAGGMGEVWRARDTRLDRSVAIKILPAEFSNDAQLKLRFEREARTISQLNHPNICTLYDIGHDSGTDYLVMELIEGESLADRIARGPLPLPDVIRYGSEIAAALERAHRSGIVHRDLKPGNVMLTKSGAKLLDFGLARTQSALGPAQASAIATQQKPLTQEGMIVGTLRYMSPEQLEGDHVDHRTDIFALGALLYEMATGRRAFDGKSRTSLIAAIVSSEPPPISQVRPLTPPALERLIRACLAKDPDARIQSAHDVAVELRWIAEGETAVQRPPRASWVPWALAALFAVAAIVAIAVHLRTPKQTASPLRFTFPPPANTSLQGIPAVSPDGRTIVFRTTGLNQSPMLWIRSLDSFDAKPLKGTEGALWAFFSPDGQHIVFTGRQKLWRLDLADGSVHALYEPVESISAGAAWSRNDVILFATRAEGQLYRIAASGGDAVRVSKGDGIEIWPWFLPDGDHFLYSSGVIGKPGIYVGSLASGDRKLLIAMTEINPARAAYASGYLIYNRGGALYAQKFDEKKLELTGDPQKLEDEIEYNAPGRAAFSVSSGGTLVYHEAGLPVVSQLLFADRTGREIATVGPIAGYSDFRISPDQRRVAFMSWDNEAATWLLDVERGALTRASFERWGGFPVWLPDGRGLVYTAAVDTPPNLFVRRADGSVERLTKMDAQNYPTDVTPDGKLVITEVYGLESDMDLVAIPMDAPHTPIPLARSKFRERDGVVSPDGKWIAFTADDNGRMEVYAMPMPRGGPRVQVSMQGGRSPRWSRDGRHLYYVDSAAKKITEVSIAVEDGELRPSAPTPLFPYNLVDYDVTRDGRFLIAKAMLNPDSPPMTVVMNWNATLK